jgi:hypothetical protein
MHVPKELYNQKQQGNKQQKVTAGVSAARQSQYRILDDKEIFFLEK